MRRGYFVSQNGERAETLFLIGEFFRTHSVGCRFESSGDVEGERPRLLELRFGEPGPL